MCEFETILNQDDPTEIVGNIVEVYASTYKLPPYNESDEQVAAFKKSWPTRCNNLGFRLVLSCTSDGQTVGMAYGWTSTVGDSWNETLRSQLRDKADFWIGNCFEFVDISVKPEFQGKGISKHLMKKLFQDLQHKTSILLTHQSATRAYEIYLKTGWTELKRDFEVSPGKKFVIMGKELHD